MRINIQINRLERLIMLIFLIIRYSIGCVYSSEFKISHNSNIIKTTIGLSFECLHKRIEIDSEINPDILFIINIWRFEEEGFNL